MRQRDDEETLLSTRSTDPSTPVVKVIREIPLPWLLGLAGIGIVMVVTSYLKLETLTTDMKKVLAAQDTTKDQLRDLQYEMRELRTRVTSLEAKEKP